MSRQNSYYWKCDEPTALMDAPEAVQGDSAIQDWEPIVTEIARGVFGDKLVGLEAGPARNRHLTYLLHCNDASYFFRADTSDSPDDYMLAETHLMTVMRGQGVPVPEVLATDESRLHYPLRYQIVQRVPYGSLHLLDQANQLDRQTVGFQLGECLAKIHRVKAPGYGYLDTAKLRESGTMYGIDVTYTDYFCRRLDDHLSQLKLTHLFSEAEVDEIAALLKRLLPLTKLQEGCIVHRDLAFWNVLGSSDKVHAIIDWEDAVVGDPADDLGVVNCFYDEATVQAVLSGYAQHQTLPADFQVRLWLHTLRNMIWKAVLRHRLNYFDDSNAKFLRSRENTVSLRTFTIERIRAAMAFLNRECA